MTAMLKTLATGKIVVCLEVIWSDIFSTHTDVLHVKGGYNLLSIASSALAVTKVLIGEPPGMLESTFPSNAAVETCQQVIMYQSKYWNCMSMKTLIPGEPHD